MSEEGFKVRGTIPPEHKTQTDLDRIYIFFMQKWAEISAQTRKQTVCAGGEPQLRSICLGEWHKYIDNLGQEHIHPNYVHIDPLDNLLERIYSERVDKVVIKDPQNKRGFILLTRDFAAKVLFMGGLP